MSSKKGAKAAGPPPVIDPAELEAAKERMKSDRVKNLVSQIQAGELGPAKVAKSLKDLIDKTKQFISSGANRLTNDELPADAAKHLAKYRDALILLNVLEGKDARESASVNSNVEKVAPALTARVSTVQGAKKTNRALKSAAETLTRKVERAEAAASSAAARAEALRRGENVPRTAAKAAGKAIVSPERLARLISTKGRDGDRSKILDSVLAGIKLDSKTPKYIKDTVDALQSQALRFNRAAKRKLMLQINLKIQEIEGQKDIAVAENKFTKSAAAIYEAKHKTLRALMTAVDTETNVELSNASAATSTTRKSRVYKRMSCKILRHPCNSKVIVTKEQLKAAVDEIMEKGWATPISGTSSAAPSRLATAAPSAFGSPVASNEEE